MPAAMGRACQTGCPEIVTRARPCRFGHGNHARAHRQRDEHRGSAQERGYDSRWQKARKAFLARHPLCACCERHGRIVPATVVDHAKPHRQDKVLFWTSEGWQPMCAACHKRKTARENRLIPCDEHGQAVVVVQGEPICRDCGRAAA